MSFNLKWPVAVYSLLLAHGEIGDTTCMDIVHMIATACIRSTCADRV